MPKKYKDVHKRFVEKAQQVVGVEGTITRKQALDVSKSLLIEKPRWLFNDKEYRAGRGVYKLPRITECLPVEENNDNHISSESSDS